MSRLLARIHRERNEREVAQAVAKALLEAGPEKMRDPVASQGGDKATLRGIPVMARGVGGAVRGSRPHADHGCEKWDGRR